MGNLEQWLKTPWRPYPKPLWYAPHDCYAGCLRLTQEEVYAGRQRLSECLFVCMRDRNPDLHIPPLPLYILAAAQGDVRAYAFSRFIESTPLDLFGTEPHILKSFEKGAYEFGKPGFLAPEAVKTFLTSRRQKWKAAAELLVEMLQELRYVIVQLATEPIMEGTGQFRPRYQQRTFADREGEIINELSSKLPNHHAKVRLLSGEEHVIRTNPSPQGISGDLFEARLTRIKRQMPFLGYVREARDVDEEVRKRQEQLRGRAGADDPPLTDF